MHSTYICLIDITKLPSLASWPGAMIKPRWFELPMSRTNFHGPKDVRAIEVRLFIETVLIATITENCLFVANSADPDQTPRSVAFDLGLHCLQRSIIMRL